MCPEKYEEKLAVHARGKLEVYHLQLLLFSRPIVKSSTTHQGILFALRVKCE